MEHHANSYGDIEPIGTRATISSTLAAGADGLDMVTDRYVSDIYIFLLSVSSFPFSHFSSPSLACEFHLDIYSSLSRDCWDTFTLAYI